MAKQWIAIDFDHTMFDTPNMVPMAGAREAIEAFRERGWRIMVHSCNSPEWIRRMCNEHGIVVDGIWGEGAMDAGQKPICAAYIDDRAIGFRGDWQGTMEETIAFVEGRPVKRG